MRSWGSSLATLAALAALTQGCNGDKDDPDGTEPDPDVCEDHAGGSVCDGNVAVQCDEDGKVDDHQACDPDTEWCRDGACSACATGFEIPYANPDRLAEGAPITVEVDPDGHPVRTRPLVLTSPGILEISGPLVVFDASGTPIPSGALLDAQTLTVGATAAGSGEIVLSPPTGCPAPAQSLLFEAIAPQPVAVRALDGFPWFETYDVFAARDTISAAVDPTRAPDREGLEADFYVVPHREADAWTLGAALTDAVAGPVTGTIDGVPIPVWAEPPSTDELLAPYDLVVDFGRDGRLDPGDLLDGLGTPALYVGGDLAAPGPYGSTQSELSTGYWTTMVVYRPDPIEAIEQAPLVVISHGNGHDYTWYDYLGQHLASHGYVVIAHRNDTQPGPVSASVTTVRNTDVFLASLPTFEGGVLDGRVDTHAIAWIGHSRGGEGVVIAYDAVVDGTAQPDSFDADDIVLVSSIAPTVFEDPLQRVNPHGVWYHLMAGSRDGDVTGGVDNPIVQYWRIFENATGPNAATYVQGADHNDFNCCGFEDADWTSGPGPIIGRERAQQLAKSYYLALLEAVFHDRQPMWEYFTRPPERFRPDQTEVVVASRFKRASGDRKLVIDDFQTNPDPELSSSGGAVSGTVLELTEGAFDDRNGQLSHDPADPFNGMSQSEHDDNPERGLVFQWDEGQDDLVLEFALPAGQRDLTDGGWLSFRACQATRHPNTEALDGMLSFGVALVDGQGRSSEIDHRVYGGITRPYARSGSGQGVGWSNEFQTVRVPIEAFAADATPIDLGDIAAIRFLFGPSHGSPVGRIGLDDIELLAPGAM